MTSWLRRLREELVPPLLFLLLVLAAWAGAVRLFNISPIVLPGPEPVLTWMWQSRAELIDSTAITARASLLGLAASLTAGVLIALVFAASRTVRRGAYPYAVLLQTVPIVAIAPLIVMSFGRGLTGVVVVSFVLSVFPVITNATTGLLSADPNLEELFRLHNAAWWQTLLKLRLPSAIPYILAGLRIASGAAVIGAIVGEFFVGFQEEQFGLGYMIRFKQESGRIDEAFGTVLASTGLGVAIFGATSLLSRAVLQRWYDESAT